MDAAVSGAMRGKTMEAAGEELGNATSETEIHAPHKFARAEFENWT